GCQPAATARHIPKLSQPNPPKPATETSVAPTVPPADRVEPQHTVPDGFRGIKWDSDLPSITRLRETALKGCDTIGEWKPLTDRPPCSHIHINTDDMDMFVQSVNVEPMFGMPVSEQNLDWSYRKFWAGELIIHNSREDDL